MIRSDRLAELIEKNGLTNPKLGKLVGLSPSMIGKMVRGETHNSSHIYSIATALGTNADYLMGASDDAAPVISAASVKDIAGQFDLVQIPQIDARYSMGGGAVIGDEVKAEPMMFSRAWIRQFTEAPISDLFWTEGDGDSMMPTIGPRDVLLGDRSQNQPVKSDQIWALTQYGHGMIKRLRATADGYTILSDNPSVPPDTATDGSMHVIGRIVAIVRRV